MDDVLLKWTIAFAGWLIAMLLACLGYFERRANQQSDLLLKAVAYFEGKTQRRSIGIALVEGFLHKRPKHRDVLIPLLTNQFVYLLLDPDVSASVHEERNLVCLYKLLANTPNLKRDYYESWCEIADAIARRSGGECSGIDITQPTLTQWRKKAGRHRWSTTNRCTRRKVSQVGQVVHLPGSFNVNDGRCRSMMWPTRRVLY